MSFKEIGHLTHVCNQAVFPLSPLQQQTHPTLQTSQHQPGVTRQTKDIKSTQTFPQKTVKPHHLMANLSLLKNMCLLTKWDSQPLQHVEEIVKRISLKQHTKLGTKLWIATDGGVMEGNGYFGWVIATDTEMLTSNYGHAPENPLLTEYLRTESIGFLSLTRFMHNFCSYHDISTPTDSFHFCDKKVLIKRLLHTFQTSDKKPNMSLHSNCDVQLQIKETLKSMSMNFKSKHVKGHQDEGPKKQLLWEAKPNT